MGRFALFFAFLLLIAVSDPSSAQTADAVREIGAANAEVVRLDSKGKYAEGLQLALKTLERAERELGPEHPETLTSVNNLASLYESLGRYGEAEPLYKRALETFERVLGKEHPSTLASLGNLTSLLTAMGKRNEALRVFRALDDRLAFWLNAETRSTQGAAIRRKILTNQSGNQDAMFSFALRHPSEAASRFAADLTLRWKKRLAQDAAYLANLIRESKDPEIVEAARIVLERQNALASAALDPSVPLEKKEALKQNLEAAEADLRRRSARYRRFLDVKRATAQQVQDALPADGALIEYRIFNPFDFKTNKYGELHLLAAVLRPSAPPALVDLGEAGLAYAAQRLLIDAKLRAENDVPLLKLRRIAHKLLVAPLAGRLKGVRTLIVSPDGPLHALPFDALLDENGKSLIETYAIRMVQTGRDLVARDRTATGKGLVAFGGIDFGAMQVRAETPAATSSTKVASPRLDQTTLRSLAATREQMRNGLIPLKHSGEEVDAIRKLYANRRADEPAPDVYKGASATEAKLKALASPPRVLHLATHGAYLKTGSIAGRPLLQSFVAMAGANKGMNGAFDADGENGILHAIEAQTLNLFGTELVVLSACQTGQGVFDYSEGLEGLPRAFYVAGAKNVLVTLWNVGDESTAAFMTEFYERWTRQSVSDPAAALIDTKKYFLTHPRREWREPQIWAAFVLYEG